MSRVLVEEFWMAWIFDEALQERAVGWGDNRPQSSPYRDVVLCAS